MSSPIHQPEDLDASLRYAPRWARDRLSPAGRPLPPPAPRLVRPATPEFSGDRAIVDLQRQLMLDPEAIPEPAVDDARTLKPMVLRLSGVMGLAALIAWGVVSLPNVKKIAEIVPLDIQAPAMTSNSVKPVQVQMPDAAPQSSQAQSAAANWAPQSSESEVAINETPPATAPLTSLPATAAPVTAVVPLAEVSSPPATRPPQSPVVPEISPAVTTASAEAAMPTPQIDETEIIEMIKRGKALLMSGDIASARLLLRRAADAGNAQAALELGATFDPLIIRQLGAVGMAPDPARAKHWYQRAADLGSASAMGQLAKLEQAQ
ncbi:MAG: hypothetical protein WAU57_08030 [Xanthobacteraceae bacterium]